MDYCECLYIYSWKCDLCICTTYYQHKPQQVADNMFNQMDSQDGYQQQTQQAYQQKK